MAIVLDKETMLAESKKSDRLVHNGLYTDRYSSVLSEQRYGDAVTFQNSQAPVLLKANTPLWEADPAREKLWTNIEATIKRMKNHWTNPAGGVYKNASQFPADYYDLINYMRIDLTRRASELPDYTGIFTAEETIPTLSQKVGLEEFLEYTGIFSEFKGRGDTVNMIEHKTGDERVRYVRMYGLGDARTLEDELFNNDIYSLEKVQRAFAKAYVNHRNDLSIGTLIHENNSTTARTYDSTQVQAAVSSGESHEDNIYRTLLGAYETLRVLLDPQTGDEIDASRVMLATTYSAAWDIERAIRGQLENTKGSPINRTALNFITSIIPYKAQTVTSNTKIKSYPGIAANTAYMFVPGSYGAPAWTKTKRGLTYEIGQGDVFSYGREKKVAYFAQTSYMAEFYGGSADASELTADSKLASGTGFVVQITLPTA